MIDAVEFLEAAVQADSTTDVSKTRELLLATLKDGGVEPRVDAAGNVRASRGAGGPHLVFNTHVDTVPPHVPFARDGEIVRGRGACDAKGPLAAMVGAFLDAEWDGDGTLTLAITPDEETLSTGAHALVTGEVAPGGPGEPGTTVASLSAMAPAPDAFVVGEPTGLDVCTAARGRFEGTVSVEGVAAHAANPTSGVNAVSGAGQVLGALQAFDTVDAHPALGEATLVPTGIDGGDATNQVPSRCEITLDRRSVPPETAEGFEAALADHLQTAVGRGPDDAAAPTVEFDLTPRETPFLEAFATAETEPLVEALATTAEAVAAEGGLDGGGAVRPFGAATEASYFAPAPTVVFGPGSLADEEGAVAHAEREYVDTRSVRAAATALTRAVERLFG